MIDDDDDIPNFVVSSGSEHHVSVSEHTGNAKTPKNKVVSHEEETQARKLAFEKNHEATVAHIAHPEDDPLAHGHGVADHTGPAGNVQKISADDPLANRQAIDPHAPVGANVQAIPTQVIAANRQGVHTDTLDSNRASIAGVDAVKDNRQAAPSDKSAEANRQKLGNTGSAPNVQGLAHEALDNQRVGLHAAGASDNHASVQGDAGTGKNNAKINGDDTLLNRQRAGDDALSDRHQGLAPANANDNRQAIPADAASANRQTVDDPSSADNLQALPQDAVHNNRQPLPGSAKAVGASASAHPSGVNEQDIPTLQEVANHQPVQDPGQPDNHQPLNTPDSPANRQAVPTPSNAPNQQAAPQAPGPGANRQALGNKPMQDHRESVSDEPVTRDTVDFSKAGAANAQDSASDPSGRKSQGRKANPKLRPGVTLPALITNPAAATPEALDAAAEFHRRVLDIKHNVENLNHRLTDFEQNQP